MRLQTNTKTLEDLVLTEPGDWRHNPLQRRRHTSSMIGVTIFQRRISPRTTTVKCRSRRFILRRHLSGVASCDGCARWVLEDQLLSASLLMCLGKRDYVERIPSGNGLYTTLPPNMVDPHLMDTVAEWVVNEINVTLFAKMCMCSATVVENAATIAMAITGSIHQAEIWATKGLLDKAKGMYLVWRSSRIKVGSLSGDCDVEKNGKWSCIYVVGSQEYQMVCTRLDKASTDVGSLKGNLQHMEALPTTKAGYMTFIEAWKKEIWLKGLLT
ncbi:hypothetical protein Tco_0614627 [Tanacetum coccineum]